MDKGEFGSEDAAATQKFLNTFDSVFAVLQDNDAQKLKELGYAPESGAPSDSEVEAKIAERQSARKNRDFAASDRIRQELADRGILIEDNRDGSVRWKRK
jgi:cysteinyl-tRNA synthetase